MISKDKIKEAALARYRKVKAARMSLRAADDDKALSHHAQPLTSHERHLISERWRGIIPHIDYGYAGFEVFKGLRGFSEDYVPSSFYYPYIVRSLNPGRYYRGFDNKCLAPMLFPAARQPRTLGMRIRGSYQIDGTGVDTDTFASMLRQTKVPFIIKQAAQSCCGMNIHLIDPAGPMPDIKQILLSTDADIIVQEVVEQSPSTARFNPSSLNTFRITSLNINGRTSICSRTLKMGAPGNIVDNIGGAGGGLMAGVSAEGVIDSLGSTATGTLADTHNGIRFGGMTIPAFDRVEKMVTETHSAFPYCGIVGWDIALDKLDRAVLIEANIWWPGTLIEQICTGPMFGNRTEEMIDYVASHPMEL